MNLSGKAYTVTSVTLYWLERSPQVQFKRRVIRFHLLKGRVSKICKHVFPHVSKRGKMFQQILLIMLTKELLQSPFYLSFFLVLLQVLRISQFLPGLSSVILHFLNFCNVVREVLQKLILHLSYLRFQTQNSFSALNFILCYIELF